MTTEPLFSIVTVTKDNLAGLDATAQSVLAQSCDDHDWVVIDGASRDGTAGLLATLPCRFVSEPDCGIYDAMNKGLAMARGRYVLFLNAGDRLADADILRTLAAVAATGADFIYGDALETGGLYKKARSARHILTGMITHHQAMLYRRGAIGELRYDCGYEIAADYGFTSAFLRTAQRIEYVPCAICIFENGGVSERRRALGRKEQFQIRASFCPAWKNAAIYAMQAVAANLRELSPRAYKWIRHRTAAGH